MNTLYIYIYYIYPLVIFSYLLLCSGKPICIYLAVFLSISRFGHDFSNFNRPFGESTGNGKSRFIGLAMIDDSGGCEKNMPPHIRDKVSMMERSGSC